MLILFCIISAGCRKEIEEPEPKAPVTSAPPEVSLTEIARWINDTTLQTLQSIDSVEIVFVGNTSQLSALSEGMVIVSGVHENAPHGFLRRITQIEQNGLEYVLTTEEVPMTEAFAELHVSYTKDFSLEDTLRDGPTFNIDLPDVIVYDGDGSSSTTQDQVRLNGNIEVKPTIEMVINISQGQLQNARIEGTFETDLTNTFIAGGSVGSFSGEITFYEQPLAALTIPATPVVIVPTLVLSLRADGSVDVSVSAGYSSELEVSAFVEYSGGSWFTGFDRSMMNSHQLSGINGNISAKGSLVPSLDFRFWGSKWARGYIQAEAYVAATASLIPQPGCQIKAGTSASIGANLQIFGWNFLNATYPNIFDYSTVLYNCNSSGGSPIAAFTAEPTSITSGGSVQFTDLSTGSPTQWQWIFPGGTPSSSTDQNPSIIYENSGIYSVTLTVNNLNESDTHTEFGFIAVIEPIDPCGGLISVMDIDGNVYNVIAVGTQCWTVENVRTQHYANGDLVLVPASTIDMDTAVTGRKVFPGAPYNIPEIGLFYNWYAVSDERNLCPQGWRVPSDNDWGILELHLGLPPSELMDLGTRGTFENVGGKMKTNSPLWSENNYGVTNESGISLLPGGVFEQNFGLEQALTSHQWTSSGNISGIYRKVWAPNTGIDRWDNSPLSLFRPCRCIKNN